MSISQLPDAFKKPAEYIFDAAHPLRLSSCPITAARAAAAEAEPEPESFIVVRCHLCSLYTPYVHTSSISGYILNHDSEKCSLCGHHFRHCSQCPGTAYTPHFQCWSCDEEIWDHELGELEGSCPNCQYPVDGTSTVFWVESPLDQDVDEKCDIDERWVMWKRENQNVLDREIPERRARRVKACVDVLPVEEEAPSREELMRRIRAMRREIAAQDGVLQNVKRKSGRITFDD